MRIPVATALVRRDRLWPAVIASAALHVFLVAWAVVRRPPPELDLDQKPIVARLVRLGEKRPEEYLPRKEAPPPPAAPPAPMSAPVAAAPAKPSAPAPGAAPAKPAPSAKGKSGTTLASVLSKVQREQEQWGSPDGDPAGDSETGTEGDRYLALVRRELEANYVLPKTISQAESLHLKATVILHLDASGRVVGHQFERRSGNAAYDAALDRAIQGARLPPPPAALRERYRSQGLGVNFHL